MPLWRLAVPLLLASASPVRRSMLEAAGIPLEVRPADIAERDLEAAAPSPAPGLIATLLAREKAAAVARLHPGRLTLGADQILSLGTQRFAKPADLPMARAQLQALCGRTHELHSAIVFARDDKVLFESVGVARLTMRAFSEQFLDAYLAAVGGAATTSVGGYQIEGVGIELFDKIEGDYFTILGLPLLTALGFLRQHGCLTA